MTYDGRWEAYFTVPTGGAAMSVTNGAGGPTVVTVPAGTYLPSSLVAAVVAQLIATRPPSTGAWTGTLSTGPTGTGRVTLNCTQSSGTWSIAWTSTVLRNVLGFAADIVAVAVAQTGTRVMRGLWLPDAVLSLDGDPRTAPQPSDFRATQSPTGRTYAVVGNSLFLHTNAMYPYVPKARAWESAAVAAGIPGASWETFVGDYQLGRGPIPWFTVGGGVQIYDHNGALLGQDANAGTGLTTGWNTPAVTGNDSKTLKPAGGSSPWTGLFALTIGNLTSES